MGKRQESREKVEAQIVEFGRRHLVIEGAAGLSLRAIARDLGMVSSAVYRYVASRDDLLTLLLVDAYSPPLPAAHGATNSWQWQTRYARGRSINPRAGRCCTAARCPAITRRASARSGRAPGLSARCSTR